MKPCRLTITIVTYYNYYMLLLLISDMKVLIYFFRRLWFAVRHMRVKPSTAQHRASLAWLCCPTERQRSASTGFCGGEIASATTCTMTGPQISGLTHFFWVLRNFRTKHVAEPHFCLSLSGARVCFCVCVRAAFTACLPL